MKSLKWNDVQEKSDLILSTGLKLMKASEKRDLNSKCENFTGNYLISDKTENWSYSGEAKSVANRINQHSKEKTSTFYGNYIKLNSSNKILKMEEFEFRAIKNNFGRKELEEFTIVNYPTNLNRFQKDKRTLVKSRQNLKLWNEIQNHYLQIIEEGEVKLRNSKKLEWQSVKIYPSAGIYWIENKNDGVIYIGESSDVLKRYLTHSGRTYFSALRRNLGETILGYKLQTIKGKKRYFGEHEDKNITRYLNSCIIKTMTISLGRFELEEYLIRKYKPILNRKENS